MKASSILAIATALSIAGLLAVHYHSVTVSNRNPRQSEGEPGKGLVANLMAVIDAQNETIYTMERMIFRGVHSSSAHVSLDGIEIRKRDQEIAALKAQLMQHHNTQSIASQPPLGSGFKDSLATPSSKEEHECEMRYGIPLIEEWAKNEQSWCSGEFTDSSSGHTLKSELTCYPYHQQHKKLDGRGADLFCRATNFFIDFSKVHGLHGDRKPSHGQQYLSFDQGSLLSPCKKSSRYQDRLFMPHHAIQMHSFQSESAIPANYITVSHPTYLLARDEDCENAFHSTADFVSMNAIYSQPSPSCLLLLGTNSRLPFYSYRSFSNR
jgi:hypothetical protein